MSATTDLLKFYLSNELLRRDHLGADSLVFGLQSQNLAEISNGRLRLQYLHVTCCTATHTGV